MKDMSSSRKKYEKEEIKYILSCILNMITYQCEYYQCLYQNKIQLKYIYYY